MNIYTLLLSTLVIISSANARIIYVDGDAPGPVHDGTSWATAYTDLQDGIADASTGDIIHVAEGRYTPDSGSGDRLASFQPRSGSELWGGFAGFGEPDPDLQDRLIYETILSGDLFGNDDGSPNTMVENSYHVIQIGVQAVVSDLTIANGNADLSDGVNYNGAGILLVDVLGEPVFVNCTIKDNRSINLGGAIYAVNSKARFETCNFSNNTANHGGVGKLTSNFPPTAPSTFYSFDSCKFNSNNASGRGGAFDISNASGAFTNCIFIDNDSFGTSFRNGGGAIFIGNLAPLIDVGNCTFIDNNAASLGGAFYVVGSRTEDWAGWEAHNSIFWNNSDKNGLLDDSQIYREFVTPPFLRHCSLQGWTGAWGGQFNNGSDPQFIDSQGRLSATSPCIDSGDSDLVPVGNETDFDGNPRFVDNPNIADTGMGTCPIVDRGAFEQQGGGCGTNDCDGDGIINSADNCPDISNPGQENHDGDSFGDVCDDDADGDGVLDVDDACVFTPLSVTVDPNGTTVSDLDGDCDVDLRDYSIMQLELTGPGH